MAMWIWNKLENDLSGLSSVSAVKAIAMDVNIMEIKMPKADGKEFSFLSEEHIDSSYLKLLILIVSISTLKQLQENLVPYARLAVFLI